MLKFVNLKEEGYTVEYALTILEIEIEGAKREGLSGMKLLHGYGSHGKGGVIAQAVKRQLSLWKRQGFIVDYFGGDKWDLFDRNTQRILNLDKSIYNDQDLGHANPGITIVQIKK